MERSKNPDYSRSPRIVIWETTRACDLCCRHCRALAHPRRDPRELTREEGFRLIETVREFGEPVFVLTGGDPCKRPDLLDLIRHGVEKGLRVCLSPSVTPLLTDDLLRRMRAAGLARIALSLDGSSREVHDAFRGIRGSFEETLRAFRAAAGAGLEVQAQTSVTRFNHAGLRPISALLAREKIVLWSVFFLVPTGRGRREDLLTPDEHEEAYRVLYEISRSVPFGVKTTCAPAYRRVVLQRRLKETGLASWEPLRGAEPDGARVLGEIRRALSPVNDGKGFVFVSHTGEVFPSGFLPVSAGNVRNRSLPDLYRESPLFQGLRDPARLKGKCGRCNFRRICGGSRARAYALTGDWLAADPTCWYEPPGFAGRAPEDG